MNNVYIFGFNLFFTRTQKIKIFSSINNIVSLLKIENYLLDISFVCDCDIKKLNKKFRNKNLSTDVLTFCANNSEEIFAFKNILGEIVISIDKANKQAYEFNHTLEEEVIALIVHGLCHLLGIDHEVSKEECNFQIQYEMMLLNCANISPKIALCGRILNVCI